MNEFKGEVFKQTAIPGDGNCLFCCVPKIVYGRINRQHETMIEFEGEVFKLTAIPGDGNIIIMVVLFLTK